MKPPVIAFAFAFALAFLFNTAAHAADRLPTIPPEKYTDEQKKAADEFMATRKVPVFGPFEPLMHSPQVMSQARASGDYLRYNSAIGNTLSELVILITPVMQNISIQYRTFLDDIPFQDGCFDSECP